MIKSLKKLRHGPLKCFDPLWIAAGKFYRGTLKVLNINLSTKQRIGKYGPFKMHAHFGFSDFGKWGGNHNRGFQQCIDACVGKMVVFDVGAHIGLVTLPASEVIGEGGKVYAFEPADGNRQFLNYHLEANKIANVEVESFLLGAKDDDEVAFYAQVGAAGTNSILHLENKGEFEQTLVRQTTIDSYCDANGIGPDLIKIDVEGAEIGVLQGAEKTLAAFKPKIFLSVHPTHIEKLGLSMDDLRQLISDFEYEVKDVDGKAVSEFCLDEYIMTPKNLENE
tara:strand:+ start:5060 stop:5896 length:837 start_codon:yes stop_codon:yes gene_type:complete